MLSVYFHDDVAFFDAFGWIHYFFVFVCFLVFVIFAKEDKALAVSFGCYKHHMNYIIIIKSLMVHNLCKTFALYSAMFLFYI